MIDLATKFPTLFDPKHPVYPACGDGWGDILNDCCEVLASVSSWPTITDIKEKYGTLRIYCDGTTDVVEAIIDQAEARSSCTCETCGAPGQLRGDGWYYTACDKHTKLHDLPYAEVNKLTWMSAESTEREQLLHAVMGLCGEAGEVSEIVKKWAFYGDGRELDERSLIMELGDVAYYLETVIRLVGSTRKEVEGLNKRKLLERHKDRLPKTGGE